MILHALERGEGRPLVLLHGLYGQAVNFGAVQRRLAAGRRTIALDLRNHGQSPRAPVMGYRAMAEDVLETASGKFTGAELINRRLANPKYAPAIKAEAKKVLAAQQKAAKEAAEAPAESVDEI